MLAEAASNQGSGSFLWIMMGLFVLGAYFMVIRPNQKRRREVQETQSALSPGAEVVTIGGLHGVVTDLDTDTVTLEVAPGVNERYVRGAIARIVSAPEKPADPDTSGDKIIETD